MPPSRDTLDGPLPKRAEALAAGGVLPPGLPSAVQAELTAADREIRPGGPLPGDTRDPEELTAAFAADIRDFVRRSGFARAVVMTWHDKTQWLRQNLDHLTGKVQSQQHLSLLQALQAVQPTRTRHELQLRAVEQLRPPVGSPVQDPDHIRASV